MNIHSAVSADAGWSKNKYMHTRILPVTTAIIDTLVTRFHLFTVFCNFVCNFAAMCFKS